MENIEIHNRLIALVTNVNQNNLNSTIANINYPEEISMIVQLIENGYAITDAHKLEITSQINVLKRAYPFYTDDLLADCTSISRSIRTLMDINNFDPINSPISIFYERFIDINPTAGDTGGINGEQGMIDNVIYIDRYGRRGNFSKLTLTPSAFTQLKPILQNLIISHEFSHLIQAEFITKYAIEFRAINNDGFGLNSKATELLSDLLGIAIVFISCRRDELINISTGMTTNEQNLITELNNGGMNPAWIGGGLHVEIEHPPAYLRLRYSQLLFHALRRIVDFDVNNKSKIAELRDLVCEHLILYYQQCYNLSIDQVDRYINYHRGKKVPAIPPNICIN